MAVIKFIGVICFTWLFVVGAAPVQFVKELFDVHNLSQTKSTIKQIIRNLINCALCMGFWFGMIFYGNIWYASIISILSEAFYRLLNKFW